MTGFFIALGLLLVVPGPTNAVLAVAGAERGLRHGLPLVFVVLAGYLTSIVPVLLFAAPVLEARPGLAVALKLAASIWVLWLAMRLWRPAASNAAERHIGASSLYSTTLLNPKGLVIALALIPPAAAEAGLLLPLAILAVTVISVSALWIAFGATAAAALGHRHPLFVPRMASSCLVVFSAGLAAKAIGLV